MRSLRRLLTLSLCCLAFSGCAKEPLLPRSFAAEMLESVDPARVRLSANGIGAEFDWAVRDAQRAAMARVIQDMVQSQEEKNRFDFVATEIYGNVVRYVERWTLQDRRVDSNGEIRVRGEVVLNRRALEDDLVRLGVIQKRSELLQQLDYPTVAVLPSEGTAGKPWTEFASNHAASYLTQRKYDVIDLAQLRQIEGMAGALKGVSGIPNDPKAVIALQAGSDVYFDYDIRLDRAQVGRDGTVKASATVKAYETTTARQIGAATGFSETYADTAGAQEKAIAEALGDAIDRVLANVEDYWKDDLGRGHQFLLTIDGTFGATQPQARRAVFEAVKSATVDLKENLATDRTLNYRVWAKGSNTELLFALQDAVAARLPGARLEEVTTNRKLLVLRLVQP